MCKLAMMDSIFSEAPKASGVLREMMDVEVRGEEGYQFAMAV